MEEISMAVRLKRGDDIFSIAPNVSPFLLK
jgi:hypothetical protein